MTMDKQEKPLRGSKTEPGPGDNVACVKCGEIALDTGLECSECGHDNWETVTGKPFRATPPTKEPT